MTFPPSFNLFPHTSSPQNPVITPGELGLGVRVEDEKLGLGKRGDVVALSRELLKQGHIHARGRTRSGKTSLVLLPLALALMEEYDLEWRDSRGAHRRREHDAMFVFDLGGDLALFNAVRKQAKRLGRSFRYFSLDPARSFYFDPFQSVQADELRVIRICNLLVEAMNMDHGLVYGGSYYTQKNLAGLLRVAERAVQKRKAGGTTGLSDIADYLDRNREKDEDQIRMTFQFLLRYPQLMPTPHDPHVIDMARAIERREVVYFYCPTMGEATTARQIAGLGLYTTVNAAMQLAGRRDPADWELPLPHCWVLIDEFQEIAGRSFAALLAQASKFGLSLVLANQTTNQLENKDLSIADIVRDNTLAKIYFTVTGKRDIDELQTFSCDDREALRSHSTTPMALSLAAERAGTSEVIVPMLRKDTILDTSATFGQFFAIIDDGRGHREPIRAQAEHRIPLEKYRKLRNTPLAQVRHVAPKPATAKATGSRETLWQEARKQSPTKERQLRIKDLLRIVAAKQAAEETTGGHPLF